MSAPLIAENVTRRHKGGGGIESVSLALEPGRVTALLGPSGAGKSTLLRVFAGFEPIETGRVRAGETVLSEPGKLLPAEQRRIGLIFQDFALFPHLTALKNVAFGLSKHPRAEAEALHWLTRLGLSDRAGAYPSELSGGEQQRVAIARALAPSPRAILMDEAFSGLDPALSDAVREAAFGALAEAHIPALLVTHDPVEALAYADTIGVLHQGRLIQHGTADEVYFSPKSPEAAEALGAVNTLKPGGLAAQTFPLGAKILVRPEGVRPDPASALKARITAVRGGGPIGRCELDCGGEKLVAKGLSGAAIGEEIGLSFDPKLTFIFQTGET